MTPRERVLTAIAHEEPDRVPIILGTNMNTSPVHQAYDRLKTLLGVEAATEFLYFEALGTVHIDETILQRLGSDARGLQDRLPRHIRDRDAANPKSKIHVDDWQVGREEVEPGDFFPLVHPLRDATSLAALETFAWPDMAGHWIDRLLAWPPGDVSFRYYEANDGEVCVSDAAQPGLPGGIQAPA